MKLDDTFYHRPCLEVVKDLVEQVQYLVLLVEHYWAALVIALLI